MRQLVNACLKSKAKVTNLNTNKFGTEVTQNQNPKLESSSRYCGPGSCSRVWGLGYCWRFWFNVLPDVLKSGVQSPFEALFSRYAVSCFTIIQTTYDCEFTMSKRHKNVMESSFVFNKPDFVFVSTLVDNFISLF